MNTVNFRNNPPDVYAAIEPYANDYTFHRWCEHLFTLNKMLYGQKDMDAYYLRAYITTLYELSNEGLEYAKKQKENDPKDSRYELLINMMDEILSLLSDDEYLMLKHFRDVNCHIFTFNYNYYDRDDILKTKSMKSYTKDGQPYYLSASEFMNKAVAVLGTTQFGELDFKKKLIQVFYPIICKYENLFTESWRTS